MIKKLRLDSLYAELDSINSLLEEAEKNNDPIGRVQYLHKKKEIELEITQLGIKEGKAGIALYFGGKPVLGSRGINADFAGTSIKEFQDIVSKVHANLVIGQMGSRGKIPLSGNSTLMVTNISKGSFGFILEELSDQYEAIDTTLKMVIDNVVAYIVNIGAEEDERFEEVINKLDGRTLLSIKDFFVNMDNSKAILRIIDGEKDYHLDDYYIHRARLRAESIEIDESPEVIIGIVQGILPVHKRIELVLDDKSLIYGSIDQLALKQYDEIIGLSGSIIGQKWKVDMLVRKVKPLNEKERIYYTLIKFIEESD